MSGPGRPGGAAAAAAWVELVRGPAALTVPGDTLAGAAAAGGARARPAALAAASSVCLYWAGMALNDWADRDVDAKERPERPIPSGRIAPGAALAAAAGLTAAGLGLAAACSRPALGTAAALAGAVWAYDLRLKQTPLGPAAMGAARCLDVLLGAAAAGPRPGGRAAGAAAGAAPAAGRLRAAAPAAAALGAHTAAVTAVSRHEVEGGPRTAALAGLAVTAGLAWAAGGAPGLSRTRGAGPGAGSGTDPGSARAFRPARTSLSRPARTPLPRPASAAGAALYALTAGAPLLRAARDPSGANMRRGVGGGIHAMVPLQAALAARGGGVLQGAALLALLPLAKRLSRKVSPT